MEEQSQTSSTTPKPALNVPTAIIIAGLIIAGAVVYTNGGGLKPQAKQGAAVAPTLIELAENVKQVSADDHIFGDPNAPVKLIEFSDTECPFCKRFHFGTMAEVMKEYGESGKVAWVYRQAPLDSLHSKARAESEATECVAKLAGNTAFWNYLNNLFMATPSNDGLDLNQLYILAEKEGVTKEKLSACAQEQATKDRVQAQLQDAINSGMNGTPYSIIIARNGKKFPVEGAQDFANLKTVIEKALAEK